MALRYILFDFQKPDHPAWAHKNSSSRVHYYLRALEWPKRKYTI